ncbi:DUT (predicted) [Pycnogonum litorale]
MNSVLKVVKLSEYAVTPSKGSTQAAGYDLYSAYPYEIKPWNKALINIDIRIELPLGCYGRIAPRSGLALKHFIDVMAGVVDMDYRGPVRVILCNFGNEVFKINRGDRIAQLICEKVEYPIIKEVQSLSERDKSGFGSS